MKKLFMIMSGIFLCVMTYANLVSPRFFSNQTLVHVEYNDSTHLFVCEDIDTLQHCINFYDIERLVVKNVIGNRILVTDMNGKVIVDTTDSIDMAVPHGNYKVYSCLVLKSMYKQQ